MNNRLLLTRIAKLLALIGMVFVAYPFFAAFLPNATIDAQRQRQWQRKIDLSELQPGELMSVDDWPGGPVAIYRRSPHEHDGLPLVEAQMHDPYSQLSSQPADLRTVTRSHSPEYFVFIPADTDRGCQIRYSPPGKQPKPDIAWYGGFSEPCNGSLYDTAGRVYRDYRSERQRNLAVPEYSVVDEAHIKLTGPPVTDHWRALP